MYFLVSACKVTKNLRNSQTKESKNSLILPKLFELFVRFLFGFPYEHLLFLSFKITFGSIHSVWRLHSLRLAALFELFGAGF